MDVLADLEARGLVADTTDRAALAERLAAGPLVVYYGVDPTADSLGFWNLLGLVTLRRLQLAGHRPIAVAGGATGMIGDPSGRSEERNLLDDELLARNVAGITADLHRVLDAGGAAGARVLDNRAWLGSLGALELLRDVGKHVTVNQMVAKESVRSRMSASQGISYTEFSYMLLQAYDYWWLAEHEGCELQIGGSDQWGNISLGVDLVRRRGGRTVHGLTWPLLTDASGQKLGKTTGGDVFLDPTRTSPYRFYQHWMRVDDALVREWLRKFTLLPLAAIDEVLENHAAAPQQREAQRTLAREVTTMVHGAVAASAAEQASELLYGGSPTDADAAALEAVAGEVPTTELGRAELGDGVGVVELLVTTGLAASRSDARRTLEQGGVYVNGRRLEGTGERVGTDDLLHGQFLLLRRGKRAYHLLRAVA